MDTTGLIDHIAADGAALADAAAAAGWDAPVPTLEWTVRDVVSHLGGVHRWATEIIRTGADSLAVAMRAPLDSGPADDELLAWFLAGHAELVSTLGDAPADLQVVTFLHTDSPLNFWARRQAHETAIHRVDVSGAAGIDVTFDADFAQDGLAEMLLGFAPGPPRDVLPESVLGLAASDGASWVVRPVGERVEAAVGSVDAAQSVVRGSSSDLYRWVWNRPSEVLVDGDAAPSVWWAENVRISR